MKTYLSWDTDVENKKELVRIPITSLECPKMNIGDYMSFDIIQADETHILMPVKVTHISISVGWNRYKKTKGIKIIEDAEQYVFVDPNIINASDINYIPADHHHRRTF